MTGRASLPAPLTPTADEFEAQIQHAQSELLESVEKAGLGRDPYRFAVGAIAHTLGVFPSIVRRLEAGRDRSDHPLDPAAVARIEKAAAAGAERRVAALAKAHSWRTVLAAAAIFVGALAVGGLAGFLAGRNTAIATGSRIEAAALRDGPDAADTWLSLMQANNGNAVRSACAAATAVTDGARKACAIGLWVEAPPNPSPRTIPSTK